MTELNENEVAPLRAEVPAPPKAMPDDRVQKLKQRAEELIGRLEGVSGAKEMELLDGIKEVGVDAQRSAAAHVDLLKSQVSGLLREGGPSKDIANGLRDLRITLDQINPEKVAGGLPARVFNAIPVVGGRSSPVGRALVKIALRYEPVSKQVTAIETGLREGQALLDRDNVELRLIYQDVEAAQERVQENAYLGELLMERLGQMIDETDDEAKRDRLVTALHDVAMRVQGLRFMEEINVGYFVGIEMIRGNNNRLGQSIENTVNMATNVVTVGLAIQAALVHEKRIRDANDRVQVFLGDMILVNAAAINRHTKEIGDVYNKPAIAMEKVAKAHDELIEALDTASRLREYGIAAAKANIATLSTMTEELQKRVVGIEEPKESPALKA